MSTTLSTTPTRTFLHRRVHGRALVAALSPLVVAVALIAQLVVAAPARAAAPSDPFGNAVSVGLDDCGHVCQATATMDMQGVPLSTVNSFLDTVEGLDGTVDFARYAQTQEQLFEQLLANDNPGLLPATLDTSSNGISYTVTDDGAGGTNISATGGVPVGQTGLDAGTWTGIATVFLSIAAGATCAALPGGVLISGACATLTGAAVGFFAKLIEYKATGRPLDRDAWINAGAYAAIGAVAGTTGNPTLAKGMARVLGFQILPGGMRLIASMARWLGFSDSAAWLTTTANALLTRWGPAVAAVEAELGIELPALSPTANVSAAGGKCVDVSGDDTGGNGAAVQMWDCYWTADDQQWLHTSDGQLRTIGRCMGVSGDDTADFTKVQLWDCNAGADGAPAPGEIWEQRLDGSLYNPNSGKCLDDPESNTANGVQLQIYDCNGASAQQFRVVGGNPIVAYGNQCVDVAGDDWTRLGDAVQMWNCQDQATDQHWTHDSDNRLHTGGLCLDINGNSTELGAQVEVWTCNGVGGQEWVSRSDGSLYNPQSGLCLDDPNGNTDNGTRLQIWTCNGLPAQQFALT